ncbi:hypothetical protein [Paenibacillus fonticola]|uniref:hypothetical protein n=1 Tax=Paenibacillus fonticola TaxID=379896 RepID=UPI000372B2BF|nr:hypothetical protein [Paenibacillus fonticola]
MANPIHNRVDTIFIHVSDVKRAAQWYSKPADSVRSADFSKAIADSSRAGAAKYGFNDEYAADHRHVTPGHRVLGASLYGDSSQKSFITYRSRGLDLYRKLVLVDSLSPKIPGVFLHDLIVKIGLIRFKLNSTLQTLCTQLYNHGTSIGQKLKMKLTVFHASNFVFNGRVFELDVFQESKTPFHRQNL